MLNSLYIENFAIVSNLELDFSDKMTAFTGETGAGKSIMIDALMLALGERADASVVRVGTLKCDIQASFTISNSSSSAKWLEQHDVPIIDGEVLLRRVIYAEGRSKSYINGIAFALQKVKELSETLVDIHGQHQHQTLLHHQTHRKQLDTYAKHHDLLQKTFDSYQLCSSIQDKINELTTNTTNQEKAELLLYQINELNALCIQDNEVENLHKEHQLLHHAKEYLEQIRNIDNLLQAEDEPNIRDYLNQVSHYLSQLPSDNLSIKNALELIDNALIQCDEAAGEILAFSTKIQLDPDRLSQIEARMAELHLLARKYKIDVKQLATRTKELETELKEIENNKELLHSLEKSLAEAKDSYEQIALELRTSRQKFAVSLANEITNIIRNLGMPKGFVEIELSNLEKMQPHGLDKIEYKVCTNPGMRLDSLAKIISGGELSRISLAIQMITAERGATPTLLFDEVDVGIGGATSALVGQLLRKLSERLQVFCVTHQPQVASSAHQHFLVEKEIKFEQTFTKVTELVDKNRINEIARMLGGITITEQTKLHAKELLELEN